MLLPLFPLFLSHRHWGSRFRNATDCAFILSVSPLCVGWLRCLHTRLKSIAACKRTQTFLPGKFYLTDFNDLSCFEDIRLKSNGDTAVTGYHFCINPAKMVIAPQTSKKPESATAGSPSDRIEVEKWIYPGTSLIIALGR